MVKASVGQRWSDERGTESLRRRCSSNAHVCDGNARRTKKILMRKKNLKASLKDHHNSGGGGRIEGLLNNSMTNGKSEGLKSIHDFKPLDSA